MHTHQLLLFVHFMGFTLWIGSMIALTIVVRANGSNEATSPATQQLGRIMDIGATLAIAAGVGLILTINPSPLKAGWMHVKLLGVFGIVGVHGFARAKLARARRAGQAAALPRALSYVPVALFTAVLALVVFRPF